MEKILICVNFVKHILIYTKNIYILLFHTNSFFFFFFFFFFKLNFYKEINLIFKNLRIR